jgi:hypothetical protein
MAFGSAGLRISALFPLACATVAFVLTMLLLFAGKQQGFMEDYHILMVLPRLSQRRHASTPADH